MKLIDGLLNSKEWNLKSCFETTLKLGYNELGYKGHSIVTNKLVSHKWPFLHKSTINKFGRFRSVRYNQVWLYFYLNKLVRFQYDKGKSWNEIE